jgi:hypothetical protein
VDRRDRLCGPFSAAHQQCYDADVQLADVLQELEEHRAKGCSSGTSRGAGSECVHLEAEIARLAVVCPGHAPTLMANAVIAYDEHRPQDSQQYLDLILSQPKPYPDAAVLRAQIALEEGNVPFARRLVEQEIMLVPDHAGLHEVPCRDFLCRSPAGERACRIDESCSAGGAALARRLSPRHDRGAVRPLR